MIASVHKSQRKGLNRNLLSFNRKVMLTTGIIPPENLSENTTKKLLFILYLIFWYFVFALLHICQILAVYYFWDNMEIRAFVLVGALGTTMIQIEVIYTRLQSSSIVKLLDFLEHNLSSTMEEMNMNENHVQIIEKAKVKIRYLSISMIAFSELMVACWIIFPITKKYLGEHNSGAMNMTTVEYEDKWLDLCFIIWAPFDITVSPYYEITYVLQIIIFISNIAHWKGIETTIMSLIIYTAAHLKVLETFLLEMKTSFSIDSVNEMPANLINNADPPIIHHSVKQPGTTELNQECVSMNKMENNGFRNEKKKLKDFIVNFVNYHNTVNEFVKMVNKVFGPVLFTSFFLCQILGCLALFEMAVTDIDTTSFINLFVYIVVTGPPFIFCWYGNEVIENSQLLRQAAFESSLAQNSKEFKHFILMVMKNTQKPLKFSALGFYTLSLEEFLNTMRAAYAYFNILKKIHGQQ